MRLSVIVEHLMQSQVEVTSLGTDASQQTKPQPENTRHLFQMD